MSDQRRVQEFRTVAEMNTATPVSRPGDGFDRFVRHAARFWALSPRVYPRGVFKFRSIDEAEALRVSHRPGGS